MDIQRLIECVSQKMQEEMSDEELQNARDVMTDELHQDMDIEGGVEEASDMGTTVLSEEGEVEDLEKDPIKAALSNSTVALMDLQKEAGGPGKLPKVDWQIEQNQKLLGNHEEMDEVSEEEMED